MKRRARFSRQEWSGKWIGLVPLPFGLGMTLGSGMTGYLNVRAWEWAQYDFADHDPARYRRFTHRILQSHPQPTTRLGEMVESLRNGAL